MPAANKSTGLQIALVFTVMGMIIAFVVAFLQYRAAADADAQKAAEIEKKNAAEKSLQTATANLQSLRQFLGYPNTDEIGKQDAEGENSVIGQLRTLMARVAPGDLTQPTVAATLQRVGQELDTLQKDRTALNDKTIDLKKQIDNLQNVYQGMVDAHTKAQQKAEADRTEAQTTKEEAVVKIEKQVNERQAKIQELQS